jgi:large subunit ribosomal protein L20
MARVRKGSARRKKHNRILKKARGYHGRTSREYRKAKQAVFRAGTMATKHRRLRKRDFRRLWITRISAACQQRDIKYSRFMAGLADSGIDLNRKMLSEIAIADPDAFDKLVEAAREKAPA